MTKRAASPLRKREQWRKLLVIFVEFWTQRMLADTYTQMSHYKSLKSFTNSELKVKTYEIFRLFFNRTSSVNDMNVKKMNFKKGVLTPLGG